MKILLFPIDYKNVLAGVSFCTKKEKKSFAKDIGVFLGFKDYSFLNQVHSGKVIEVVNSVNGEEGDALFTFEKGIMLSVFTADCVPVYIYGENFVGIIHAGWRGFVNGIFENFFNTIKGTGLKTNSLKAIVGVSICGDCYEVGEDVAIHFSRSFLRKKSDGKFLLDLKAASVDRLIENGLKMENIQISPYCTKHHSYFHSYRRDKTDFRNVNFIGLKGD